MFPWVSYGPGPPRLQGVGPRLSASCRFFHLQGPPYGVLGPVLRFLFLQAHTGPPTGAGPMVMSFRICYFHLRVSSIRVAPWSLISFWDHSSFLGDAFDAL